MRLTRVQHYVLWITILTAAVGIVTNVATERLPSGLEPYRGLAWPLLGVLIVLLLVVSVQQARAPKRRQRQATEQPGKASLWLLAWRHRHSWFGLGLQKQPKLLTATGMLVLLGGAFFFSPLHDLCFPLPDHIYGTVKAVGIQGMRVQLLDRRGDVIPAGRGAVDSLNGAFVLWYSRVYQPHTLRVMAPGCSAQPYPVERAQLRAGRGFDLEFICWRETS